MLARKIVVRCGDKRVDWESFEHMVGLILENQIVAHFSHQPYAAAVLDSDAARMISCKTLWTDLQFVETAEALEYLLTIYRDMECTEIRDRVYGFLGLLDFLTPEEDDFSITIDYSMSVTEVFTEVYQRLENARKMADTKSSLRLIEALRDALRIPLTNPAINLAQYEILSTITYQKFVSPPSAPPDREKAFTVMLEQYKGLRLQT
jgi:hypothetical protein